MCVAEDCKLTSILEKQALSEYSGSLVSVTFISTNYSVHVEAKHNIVPVQVQYDDLCSGKKTYIILTDRAWKLERSGVAVKNVLQ